MRTCSKEFNLHVEPDVVVCGALTDWTNPGSCRLRIQGFDPATWIGLACPTCNASAGPAWNGEYPSWLGGTTYAAAAGFSLDGKNVDVSSQLTFFGGNWHCTIICIGAPGGYIFNGVKAAGPSPLGIYLDAGFTNCAFIPLNLTIEAYSL